MWNTARCKGFDHLAEVYAAMKKEKPDFKIGETAMYVWATELKDDGHLAEAIDVLKLELQIYPDNSDAKEKLKTIEAVPAAK
jgi:hypothetical protein